MRATESRCCSLQTSAPPSRSYSASVRSRLPKIARSDLRSSTLPSLCVVRRNKTKSLSFPSLSYTRIPKKGEFKERKNHKERFAFKYTSKFVWSERRRRRSNIDQIFFSFFSLLVRSLFCLFHSLLPALILYALTLPSDCVFASSLTV